ncbi:hypothetical protein LCGC14_2944950, partial [marine sediment metagenome]
YNYMAQKLSQIEIKQRFLNRNIISLSNYINIKTEMKCKCFCGKEFFDYPCNRKGYCSRKCMGKAYTYKIKTNCLKCGKEFLIKRAGKKRGRGKYCSKHCVNWKGGFIQHRGYIFIHKPRHPRNNNGYIPYHRFVMEQYLGRILKSTEVVHHINSNLSDNKIENLKLFSSHSKHMKFHRSLQ